MELRLLFFLSTCYLPLLSSSLYIGGYPLAKETLGFLSSVDLSVILLLLVGLRVGSAIGPLYDPPWRTGVVSASLLLQPRRRMYGLLVLAAARVRAGAVSGLSSSLMQIVADVGEYPADDDPTPLITFFSVLCLRLPSSFILGASEVRG